MNTRYGKSPNVPCCAIFGHTPDKIPYAVYPAAYRARLVLLLQDILKDSTNFIVGLKPGVDLWCSAALMDFKRSDPSIRIHAFLINPPHEYSENDKKVFFDIVGAVDTKVSYGINCGFDYKQRRTRDMVENATMVLAIDAPALPLGCARQMNIPIVNYSIADIMGMTSHP